MTSKIPEPIVGNIIAVNGKPEFDENAKRVFWLVENELLLIGTDESGWDSYYRSKTDGTLWKRVYLNSEEHGGGAPSLFPLSDDEAARIAETVPKL